jgi:hypothetical protein
MAPQEDTYQEPPELTEQWERSIFGFLEGWIRWIIDDPRCSEPDPAEPFWEVVRLLAAFAVYHGEVEKAAGEGKATEAKNAAFFAASCIGRAAQIATDASADSAAWESRARGRTTQSELAEAKAPFARLGALVAALDMKRKNPSLSVRVIAEKLTAKDEKGVPMSYDGLYRFLLTVPMLRRWPREDG